MTRGLLAKSALVTAVLVVAPLALVGSVYAAADPPDCPPVGPCVIVVEKPGNPGTPGGGGGNGGGGDGGSEPICDPDLGCLNPDTMCWWKEAEPQPPKSDPVWQGHTDGAIFVRRCVVGDGKGLRGDPGELVWSDTVVAEARLLPAPATLAQRAVSLMNLRGPDIGMSPDPVGSGLVGLPVWLWTAVGEQTWGPITRTAAVPGLSVTATGHAVRIAWNMGDGHTVTCENPGTPYAAAYGHAGSPTCGYKYERASRDQAGGRFTVTGTTTWQVNWAGGGESGTLTVTRTSTTTAQIDELQVVTS